MERLSDVLAQCDLALATDYNGEARVIAFFANAKGRAALKELNSENFPDDGWADLENTGEVPPDDWKARLLRHKAHESTEQITVQLVTASMMLGCRVMVSFEGDEFETPKLGTLADIPHAGSA